MDGYTELQKARRNMFPVCVCVCLYLFKYLCEDQELSLYLWGPPINMRTKCQSL